MLAPYHPACWVLPIIKLFNKLRPLMETVLLYFLLNWIPGSEPSFESQFTHLFQIQHLDNFAVITSYQSGKINSRAEAPAI